ncbi:MAG: SH3 domain-containing protein [Prevotella sp.]
MYGIVVGGTLNRRASASQSAAALGSYADGSYITIENHNDEWYRTTFVYNGSTTTGYVKKAYVVKWNDTVKVRKNAVNVRDAADGNSILYTVNSGVSTRISSIEKVGTYGWIQGDFGQGMGWVRGDMFTKVSSGSSDTGGSEVSGFELGSSFSGSVIAPNVNLRYGPSTSYGSRGALQELADVDVRMITAGGTTENREAWLWCNQRFNNLGSGFVYARYISVKSGTTFPAHRINGSSVNIRVRPTTSAESFGTLNQNDTVYVLDTTHTGWWRVSSSIGIGWVSSNYIA